MSFAPVAADNLPYRIQPLSAAQPYGEFQHQPLRVWTPSPLKPNASEQPATDAKYQLSVSGKFMHVEPRSLDIAQLAPRIVSTRAAATHASSQRRAAHIGHRAACP